MFQRLVLYFQGMFPPLHAMAVILYAYAFILGLHQLQDTDFTFQSFYVRGAISLLFLVLLIRVMDEFKDYEDDLINFPDRPLPSAQVKKSDLKFLGGLCFVLPLILNVPNAKMFGGVVICLLYSLFMLKWFFFEEKMRKSLPLALITHHPIAYLYLIYMGICFLEAQGLEHSPETWSLFWIILPVGLPSTNWEFSRKLRAPQEEDTYTTYSKIWGSRNACMVALSTQILCLIGFTVYYQKIDKPVWFLGGFIAVFIFLMLPYILFAVNNKHNHPMKVYAERQSLFLQVALIGSYFISTSMDSPAEID